MTRAAADRRLGDFARAFPFHIVIAPDLSLVGVGSGLLKMEPSLVAGGPLSEHFDLVEPDLPLSWQLLQSRPDSDFSFVHRATRLELRGRIAVPDGDGPVVFLGTSWLDDATQLADFGVTEDLGSSAKPQPPSTPAAFAALDDGEDLQARCRQLQRRLNFYQAVTRSLGESRDAETALRQLTLALPPALGWRSAALWTRDGSGTPQPQLRADCRGREVAANFGADRADDDDRCGQALALAAFRSATPQWSADGCESGTGGLAITANTDSGTIAVITVVSGQPEPDGSLLDDLYLGSGQLARFLSRQQQRERLARLTSEIASIFQLTADGFVAFNGKGRVSYVNPAFARMTGFEREDLRGLDEFDFERQLSSLIDPRQPAQTAGNGDPIVHFRQPRETVLQRSRRDARDLEGRLVGRLLHFRDITLETELMRANGEFLSNAAHELRTPMASIHGFVELLLKQELPPDKRRQVLETIHRQSTRLIEIVNELLEVARFDARAARDLDCRPLALAPLVRSTAGELMSPGDPHRATLALPADADSPWVLADRDRLIQALVNVLSNAFKYSPDGGEVIVSLSERKRSEQDWAGITVRDRGIGMTPQELERVFDRFFRAHPAGTIPGTGLGMAMVKKIIDGHGGQVEIASTVGEGTEVTLWLPRCTAPEALAK